MAVAGGLADSYVDPKTPRSRGTTTAPTPITQRSYGQGQAIAFGRTSDLLAKG